MATKILDERDGSFQEIESKLNSIDKISILTESAYEDLTPEQKSNGTIYMTYTE